MAVYQIFHRRTAHLGCKNTVAQRRRAAALNVGKAGKTAFDAAASLDHTGKLFAVISAHTLGSDNNEVTLAAFAGIDHFFDNVVEIGRDFFYYRGNRAQGDRGLQRDIACIPAHNLYNGAAGMAFAGIAQFIYKVYDGVHCGIEAYGRFGRSDIVIDSAGDTYAGHTVGG